MRRPGTPPPGWRERGRTEGRSNRLWQRARSPDEPPTYDAHRRPDEPRTLTPKVGLQRRVTPPPPTPSTNETGALAVAASACGLSQPHSRRRRQITSACSAGAPKPSERDRQPTAASRWRRAPSVGELGAGRGRSTGARRSLPGERGRCNSGPLSRPKLRARRRVEAEDTPRSGQRQER